MSNTKNFADLMKVCSILPALLVMPAMAEVPEGFVESTEQTISEPMNIAGETYENLYVRSPEETPIAKQNLTNLYFSHGTKTSSISNSKFHNNNAEVGGAIAVAGGGNPYWPEKLGGNQTEVVVTNSTFSENSALYDAGAIGNYGFLTIGEGVEFRNNTSVNGIDTLDYMGGGALGLGSLSTTTIDDDTKFIENYSGTHGGAIATRRSENGDNHIAKLDIKGYFELNESKYRGGAIYNTFYNGLEDGTGVTVDADFVRNHAGQSGGAIYNDGVLDKSSDESGAVMTINDSDFEYNTAGVNGGAIYSTGKLTIADSDFVENSALEQGGAINSAGTTSELYISNSKFENNKVTGETENFQLGGAIKISGIAEISDTDFIGNSADGFAGAIYAGTSSDVTLERVLFQGNTAGGVGALGLYKNGQLKDVRFIENHSLEGDSGALFLGAVSSTYVDGTVADSWFEGNTAATSGGGIGTRNYVEGDNKDAYLDIKNTTFVSNIAGTNGGAFDNHFYHSYTNADAVYVENGVFTTNEAINGGAVYNRGAESAKDADSDTKKSQVASIEFKDTSFTGNIASGLGGAIYNETGAKVFLSGINTFTGNTANGVANDIYNLGTLTIASGTTTIDGGITGDGVLDIKSGATLDVGSAIVEQSAINVDGVLKTYALNAQQGINIFGDVTGSGTLQMNVGTAGTYDMSQFADLNLEYVGTVFESTQQGTDMIFTAKSTEKLVAETGMSTGAASAVSSLVASKDAKLQQISLIAQDVLSSGDIAVVEKELAKVGPEEKPVSHSVASSVQGQVLTVASGRMASVGGASAGRAGGEVTGAGVWAQGLFNKSKLNGQFHGYTRGLALGADTIIDDVYTIGAGYAYNNTDIHAAGRDTGVESNSVFVYGQYKPAEWFVNTTLNYTTSEYADAANVFGIALDNEYDADAFGMQTMFGYDFENGVTPMAGMRYLHVSQDAHRDALGRTIKEMDTNFLSVVTGVNYAFEIENDWAVALRPELHAAMTYDVVSEGSTATIVVPGSAAYYVDIENLSRLGGEFGIGLTAEYRGLEVSLNYELDLHEDYTSQTGLLKFRYDF